jgi:hypothetical protein
MPSCFLKVEPGAILANDTLGQPRGPALTEKTVGLAICR